MFEQVYKVHFNSSLQYIITALVLCYYYSWLMSVFTIY